MSRRSNGRLVGLVGVALLAAAMSLGVAACGGGGDEDNIRTVVNHLADSDEAVCSEFTDAYLKKIFKTKANCEKQAKDSKETNSFDIKDVKVNGTKASVDVAGKKDKGKVSLVKDSGDWKIESIVQTG